MRKPLRVQRGERLGQAREVLLATEVADGEQVRPRGRRSVADGKRGRGVHDARLVALDPVAAADVVGGELADADHALGRAR